MAGVRFQEFDKNGNGHLASWSKPVLWTVEFKCCKVTLHETSYAELQEQKSEMNRNKERIMRHSSSCWNQGSSWFSYFIAVLSSWNFLTPWFGLVSHKNLTTQVDDEPSSRAAGCELWGAWWVEPCRSGVFFWSTGQLVSTTFKAWLDQA